MGLGLGTEFEFGLVIEFGMSLGLSLGLIVELIERQEWDHVSISIASSDPQKCLLSMLA